MHFMSCMLNFVVIAIGTRKFLSSTLQFYNFTILRKGLKERSDISKATCRVDVTAGNWQWYCDSVPSLFFSFLI